MTLFSVEGPLGARLGLLWRRAFRANRSFGSVTVEVPQTTFRRAKQFRNSTGPNVDNIALAQFHERRHHATRVRVLAIVTPDLQGQDVAVNELMLYCESKDDLTL